MAARLAMPGLAVDATLTPYTYLAATLAMPGLDVIARPTLLALTSTQLNMPGLAVTATVAPYSYLAATLAMPGLSVTAPAVSTRDVAASLGMPGLAVPTAIVSGPGLGATLSMPGLAVPTATVVGISPTPLAATLAMPGLAVPTALFNPSGPTFLLAPVYGNDWNKLQNLVPPSVVQIGTPVSNGVRMSGNPTGPESSGNVALVSKNKSGPGWSAAFTLKRTDAFAPASGGGAAFLILYVGAVGDGTPGFPADIAQWPPTTEPYTSTFAAHIHGARLTFFFNNSTLGVDAPPSVPALAVFQADGSVTTIPGDGSPTALNQARNFPFNYTLALSTASPPVLTLTQHDASVPTDRTVTWTSPLLASLASPSQGSFIWLCTPGRVVEITAESFTAPAAPQPSATLVMPGLAVPTAQVDSGSVGTGWPNGYLARRRLVLAPQPDLLPAETIADHVPFVDTSKIPGDWSWLAPAASVDPGASSANRPYGAAAPWNIPVKALPRHPDEANLCDLLFNSAGDRSGNLNVENTDYSFPVYYALAGSDPNATLPVADDTYTVISADTSANMHNQTMPWNSAWTVPAGSDAQAIVLDPTTGKEWNLWQVVVHTATKIINVGNASLVPGDYRTRTTGWAPSRGSGIPYLAMLVRPFEVTQGRIDHALAMGIINVSLTGGFVGPATKTDGPTFGVDPGIREGTRFYLQCTDAERETWVASLPAGAQAAARVLANAWREYGAVVTDHAGNWQVQLEDRLSAGAAWDALGLGIQVVGGKTYPRDLFDGLVTRARLRAAAPSPYGAWTGELLSWAEGRPLDLRLEDAGTGLPLDYQLVRYGGPGIAWLAPRLDSVASDVGTSAVLAYSGKAVAVSEENVPGVWRAALVVIDPTTGADLTGKGRDVPRFGTLTNTTLDGRPAAQFVDGSTTGYLRRTSGDYVALLDRKTDLTEEVWAVISTAASGNGVRFGGDIGDATQTFPRARFSWWAEHLGSTTGTAPDVLQMGAQWWDGANYHNESTESVAHIADGATHRHLMIVHSSNQHTLGYDGETDINNTSTGFLNAPSAGNIHPQPYENMSLGAATATQNKSPGMTLGVYALWPKAWSATERAMRDRPQRDGGKAWGVGAADARSDPVTSPVAVPVARSIVGQTDLDVAALAFDDQLPRTVALVSVTADQKGNSAITASGGKVRVIPNSGVSLVPSVADYVVGKGAKRSTSRLYLTVSDNVIGPTGAYPDYALPAAVGTRVVTDMAGLSAAVSGASQVPDGWHIVLAAGSTFSGNLTITRNVAAPKYIVIKCEKHDQLAGAAASATSLLAPITGNLTINGQGWIVKGINFLPNATSSPRLQFGASRIRLTRFRIVDPATTRDIQVGCSASETTTTDKVLIDRFEVGNRASNGLEWSSKIDRDITVSWFNIYGGQGIRQGSNTGIEPFFLGTGAAQSQYKHCTAVGYGVIHDDIGAFEMKGSRMLVEHMSLIRADEVHFRHGSNNLARGLYLSQNARLEMRGIGNVYLSCVAENTSAPTSFGGREGNFDVAVFFPTQPNGQGTPPAKLTFSPRPQALNGKIIDCSFDKPIQLGTPDPVDDLDQSENIYGPDGKTIVASGGHQACTGLLFAKVTVGGRLITSKTDASVQIRTGSPNPGNHEAGTVFQAGIPSSYTPVTPARLAVADVGWQTPSHAGDGGPMP